MSYYKVNEVEDGVYRLVSAEAVFCELIVGEEKALLLDTGWGLGPLADTVREITDKSLIVVNSHGHVDHVCGNNQFQGNIYIHPRDMELVKAHGSRMMKEFILAQSGGDDSQLLPEGFDKEAYLSDGNITYVPVEENHVLDLGGTTLKVLELPGHTAGSIGLWCEEKQILFVGDAINGCLLLSGQESASMDAYISSLKKAKDTGFEKMYGGHAVNAFTQKDLDRFLHLAEGVDWENSEVFRDPNKPDAKPNENVHVKCVDGMTMKDIQNPDFACIIFSKDKLERK